MEKIIKMLIKIFVLIIVIIAISIVIKKQNNSMDYDESARNLNIPQKQSGIMIVPTMHDKISADTSWCGTFQLVWNDMKNEVVKQDIIFTPQEEIVENLNKEEFTEDMLSDEYYFKIYGLKSLSLKEQIEKGIKEKFNQTSDILNDFDWSEDALNNPENPDTSRYFFYVMLYREFQFLKEFDKLENAKFGQNADNIEYFGIDSKTKNEIGDQIDVLYYNSKDDFAILINTKSDDEVIFCKNPIGDNFSQIYKNMNEQAEKYSGSLFFEDIDEFKAPKIDFNEKKEYKELQNKEFITADGEIAEIEKAIQSVKFSLDEKGGKIKSEAAIDMKLESAAFVEPEIIEPRYFYVDDTFALFLREKGQEMPYFAARFDDITKFQ